MKELDFSMARLKTSFQRQVFNEYCRVDHKISKAYRSNLMHSHEVFEALLCLSDDIFILRNDILTLLHKNDLILFNDTDIHGIIADHNRDFERMVLMFDPAFVKEFRDTFDLLRCFYEPSGQAKRIYHLSQEQAENTLAFFHSLSVLNNDDSDVAKMKKKLLLASMLLEINILYDEPSRNEIVLETDPQFNKIQRVIAYINENLAQDLSLDAISKQFYISTSYLSAIFKEITGHSVNNYIINKRILLAAELLKQNRSVSSVTESCGFNNYSHFIRTFKKFEGVSPKQYAMKFRKSSRPRSIEPIL